MQLKKYQTKQIKNYQSNKIIFDGLSSKKIWLILSTPNITALKKQLIKIKTLKKYKYLINSHIKKLFKYNTANGLIKTVAVQLDSFTKFEEVINLIKKNTTSMPKYFLYNNAIYDYTFFYDYKKKNNVKNILLPIRINKVNTYIISNLIKTITYKKC